MSAFHPLRTFRRSLLRRSAADAMKRRAIRPAGERYLPSCVQALTREFAINAVFLPLRVRHAISDVSGVEVTGRPRLEVGNAAALRGLNDLPPTCHFDGQPTRRAADHQARRQRHQPAWTRSQGRLSHLIWVPSTTSVFHPLRTLGRRPLSSRCRRLDEFTVRSAIGSAQTIERDLIRLRQYKILSILGK